MVDPYTALRDENIDSETLLRIDSALEEEINRLFEEIEIANVQEKLPQIFMHRHPLACNVYIYNLDNFKKYIVRDPDHFGSSAEVRIRYHPDGEYIPGMIWRNGDPIRANWNTVHDEWALVYNDGVFGYIESKYLH